MAAQRRETLKAQAQSGSLVDVVPNLAFLCLVMLRLRLQETIPDGTMVHSKEWNIRKMINEWTGEVLKYI